MKKTITLIVFIAAGFFAQGSTLPGTTIIYPYPDRVGTATTTAIHKDSTQFVGWADGYTGLTYGAGVDTIFRTPEKALGKAAGGTHDIVCLGDGGQITMTFSKAIIDGSGFDFAVFENAFSDTFLELAWIEVSSDGINFVRFPNFYANTNPVSNNHDTWKIYGLAGKYISGYGTPFDLAELQSTYTTITNGTPSVYDYYPVFKQAFTNNFPYLNTSNILYVRIIDIIGNGSAKDTVGLNIYDPYPTTGSAGFDLDAVGVINQAIDNRQSQTITFGAVLNQKLSTGEINLTASAGSGLPVSYTLLEGNATVSSNRLIFTGTGHIVVQAQQPGDATYAPAVPVTQSFYVADKIQHIYVEPVPNQTTNSIWQVRAAASSGLPVSIELSSGPTNALINQTNHLLTVSNLTGTVELRAWQSGNAEYAPADDVRTTFSIVSSGAAAAPKTFAQWSTNRSLTADAQLDSDGDGAKNLQEFVMGTDPKNSNDVPRITVQPATNSYGDPTMLLNFRVNRQAYGRALLQKTDSLSGGWINAIPEVTASQSSTNAGQAVINLTVQLPVESPNQFFRLQLQDQ
ncbi:MAG: hypothetical protein WC701_05320 [Kiritimatiellales bacterium]|jgi:hypothetical protein